MADDIDIEEHDVLESLRRRQGPGDVVVKSEPLEIEHEEPHYEDPANVEYQWEWDKEQALEIKVEPREAPDEFRFGKIILGSKPAVAIDQQETESKNEEKNYNYNMSLVLDDWGPTLDRSDCYCKVCQILFATVNALDAHRMIAHSFLVATDKQPSPERNKAIKSTAKPSNNDDNQTCKICKFYFKGPQGKFNLLRHYRRKHHVDPKIINGDDFKSWRICNHCNMYFPDDTSLVKHLYELLPLNDKTPNKDDKKVAPSAVKAIPLNIDKNSSKAIPNKEIKSTNVKVVDSIGIDKIPIPNRIILGSKPAVVKSEPKLIQWKCEICDIEYGRKYYLKHMSKFHPDFLIKKFRRNSNKTIQYNNATVRYKCEVCKEIVPSYYAMRKHRLKHPETKGKPIVHKLVKLNKINKVKAKPTFIKKEHVKVYAAATKVNANKEPMEENKQLVSKSTLFKCSRCSVHFLTCTGACQHSMVCESSSNIRDWACPKCQRVFKSVEKSAHLYQHRMNASKFKVYVVYLEMIVRILCECPECFVCFEEDKFWRHVRASCNDAASYYCGECKLAIDIHAKANHDSKHKQGDFTKDDFIKIEYLSFKQDPAPNTSNAQLQMSPVKNIKTEVESPKRALKRKWMDTSEVPADTKKFKLGEDLLLFYCQYCKSYLGLKNPFHSDGKCKFQKGTARVICRICGILLKYTYHASHMSLHKKCPNLTLNDLTFIRMSDSKKTRPQPQFLPCKNCNVFFMTKAARRTHKCGQTPSMNCQMCQKKIQKDVFKLHMQIHNYIIPSKIKTIHDLAQQVAIPSKLSRTDAHSPITESLSRKETESPITKLPDLLMKYKSLTALWNILYLCATCDTFTDSYDKVIEHCQNHLTNMENYGVVIKKCQTCNMKFDSECYKRHLELHAGSRVINKKTFQILNYDYQNLFSKFWLDFIELPEEQKSQIVGRSIYGATRSVKMKLVQQGPPEYTLYKCNKCLNCVDADTILYHIKLSQCARAIKLACSICTMTFTIKAQLAIHEEIHNKTGLGLESFRIVTFNDPSDLESNMMIMSHDTEHHGSRSKIVFADDDVMTEASTLAQNIPNRSFVLYKCAECDSCVIHMKNFANHACYKGGKKRCDKCGLSVNAKIFHRHERLHQKYSFSSKNVITKTLNKEGKVINIKKQSQDKFVGSSVQHTLKSEAGKPNLYKCFCGLHYTSLKTIEKHYKMKNCSTAIREKCSQCNLVFDAIEVVNHLCKHHAQNRVTSFNIVTPNKKTLFKCDMCHVLFYSKAAAVPHKATCTGKYYGKKCEKCGLAFDTSSLPMHMIDHERNNKLRTDCYVIVKIPDETTEPAETYAPNAPNNLYKCYYCDVHFVRRSSARNHILKYGRCDGTLTEICRICKLAFPAKSIWKHVGYHHKKLRIKHFNIVKLIVGVNMKGRKGDQSAEIEKFKVFKHVEATKLVPVDVTVYRCVKCLLHFTDESSLANHKEDRCSKELAEDCDDCSVKFAARNIREHKKQHGPGLTLCLNAIEEVLSPARRNDAKKFQAHGYEPKSRNFKYDNKLYKCIECNFHYNSQHTLELHTCNPNSIRMKCEECDIDMTKHSLCRHNYIHQKYNYKKDDFVIVTLSDDAKSKQVDSNVRKPTNLVRYDFKLYKCTKCNLHFNNIDTLRKHEFADLHKSFRLKCEECNIAFTKVSMCRHKQIHEKYHLKKGDFVIMNSSGIVIPNVEPECKTLIDYSKIYLCTQCNSHFNYQHSLQKHIKKCNPDVVHFKCEECDINFTKYSLQNHEVIHTKYKLRKGDFTIFTLDNMPVQRIESNDESDKEIDVEEHTTESLDSSVQSGPVEKTENITKKQTKASNVDPEPPREYSKIFLCTQCNSHFNLYNSLQKHVNNCNPNVVHFKCEECDINFTKYSLQNHEVIHTKYKLKKGDFTIFTLDKMPVQRIESNDRSDKEIYVEEHNTESLESSVHSNPSEKNGNITKKQTKASNVDPEPPREYSKIFLCTQCNSHFNLYNSLQKHVNNCNPNVVHFKCEECDINFTKYSLQNHEVIHTKYKLKKGDFTIFTLDNIPVQRIESNDRSDKEIDVEEHNTESLDSSVHSELKTENIPKEQTKVSTNVHHLYKCADCNVYYMLQRSLHKHITKHTPLDPKDYIECKLCGFQFLIMALPPHIKKHHAKPFNLEEVLVEEYKPNNIVTYEKYYASEKDQSSMVSTSDDVNNVSHLMEENDCEVTSCAEIAEEINSSDQQVDDEKNTSCIEIAQKSDSLVNNDELVNKAVTEHEITTYESKTVESSVNSDLQVTTHVIDDKMKNYVEIAQKSDSLVNNDQLVNKAITEHEVTKYETKAVPQVTAHVIDYKINNGIEITQNIHSSENKNHQSITVINDNCITTATEIEKKVDSSKNDDQLLKDDEMTTCIQTTKKNISSEDNTAVKKDNINTLVDIESKIDCPEINSQQNDVT